MSRYPECAPMYDFDSPDQPLRARIDIKKASMVNDVSLDDTVTITITGKVCRLDGAEEYKERDYSSKSDKKVNKLRPGTLEVEVSKITVIGEGFGAEMDEDDE